MSLVAASRAEQESPIVIGDIAISGEGRGDWGPVLPSYGAIDNFYPSDGWTITDFKQKVAVLADDLVLAWSGSPLGGGIVFDNIREQVRLGRTLTAAEINDYLASASAPEIQDTQFVGWKAEGSRGFSGLGARDEHFTPRQGPAIYAGGSGVPVLKKAARLTWGATEMRDTIVPWVRAVEKAMLLTGHLLRSEHADGLPLLRYFGGNYEIAFFDGQRFRKRGDLTYMIWDAKAEQRNGRIDVSFSHPLLIVSNYYHGDWLLQKGVRFSGAERGQTVESRDRFYSAVRPAGTGFPRPTDLPDANDLPLIGQRICNIFAVESETGRGHYTGVQGRDVPCVLVTETRETTSVRVHPDFVVQMCGTLKAGIYDGAPFSQRGNVPLETLTRYQIRD